MNINSYDDYRNFILKSRERKDKRENSFSRKNNKKSTF